MLKTSYDPIYYFSNDESEKIIEDYGISYFKVSFDDTKIKKGLELLLEHSINQLEQFREVDEYDILINLEATRYFCYAVKCQTNWNIDFQNYYTQLLSWFHYYGFLTDKETFGRYKDFKNKKPCITINYDFNNIHAKIVYKSFSNLAHDYGKNKSLKIVNTNLKVIDYKDVVELFA